jgi:diguanylate cyclase (GGDEF)-like protein
VGDSASTRLERAAAVAGLSFVAFLMIAPGPDRFVQAVDNIAQLVVPLLAALAAAIVARVQQGRMRWSWTYMALACVSWAGGQLVWTWYEVIRHEAVPSPSLADIGYLGAIPLLIAGVVSYPAAGLLPNGRVRLTLDALTIALGLLVASHPLFLGTVLSEELTSAQAIAVAYPMADLVAIAIIVAVMLRRRDGARGPLPLMIAGFLALAVADVSFAYETAGGGLLGDQPTNAGWVIGFGLIGVAALRVGTDTAVPALKLSPVIRGENVITAVPVALAALVLAARSLMGEDVGPFLGVTGGLLLVVVASRQLAIQLDNNELNDSLRSTVEQLQAREDELRHRAFHDPLTGLANRDLFRNRLEHALLRRRDTPVAVAFIDLDDFKTVNDSLGHDAGDQLLRSVAERIQACIRPGDTVARLGGDEFAVLMEDAATADKLGRRLLDAFEVPFATRARELHVATSIGIATGVGGTHTVQQLLQDADLAMYAAKAAGKGRVTSFRPSMREGVVERLDLLHDLDVAVERDELFLEYQPVLRLATGETAGYEALLRWRHPTRGVLQPAAFLQLAEESGRMEGIGWWALEEAFRRQQRLPVGDGSKPWISVNLSAKQLLAPSAPQALAHAIAVSGIDPGRVVLELTEGALLTGIGVPDRLQQLKAQGVRLAVDDFGIGYSSLSYLAQLPFDIVKIDRSFVDAMGHDGDEGGEDILIAAIVQLAASLDIRTIAEGVEQQWQLDRLRELGCHGAQGFLIGRPARDEPDGPAGAAGAAHPAERLQDR